MSFFTLAALAPQKEQQRLGRSLFSFISSDPDRLGTHEYDTDLEPDSGS